MLTSIAECCMSAGQLEQFLKETSGKSRPISPIGHIELEGKLVDIVSGTPLANNPLKDNYPGVFENNICTAQSLEKQGLVVGRRIKIGNVLSFQEVLTHLFKNTLAFARQRVTGIMDYHQFDPKKIRLNELTEKLGAVALAVPFDEHSVRLVDMACEHISKTGTDFLYLKNGGNYYPIGRGRYFWPIAKKQTK